MITHIKARDIPDAWFQLLYGMFDDDAMVHEYKIDVGSYVGQRRLEYDYAVVEIDNPGHRPLIPQMPEGSALPPPVESHIDVALYFANYLMSPYVAENETYTYGQWLAQGIVRVIRQLRNGTGNNQATINVGGWVPDAAKPVYICRGCYPSIAIDTDSIIDPATGQCDPACLRVVDFRLDQQNQLHMYLYFRSWDLWGGFPANLAGLQMLKEYVAQEIDAKDGAIVACTKGLHLYDHCWDIARARTGR